MKNPEVSKIESGKTFFLGRKEKEEQESEKPKVSPENMEQATKLSEEAEKLAEQGYEEKKENPIEAEQKIQEAREMLAKASEILEGEEIEETEGTLEGREDKEVLEKLFNEQTQWLLHLGYPEALGIDNDTFLTKYIEPLREELDKVPENIPENNLPFLIVFPSNIIDIKKKMSMVKLRQKTGHVWRKFNFKKLEDAEGIETPEDPYLIFDIENGFKTKRKIASYCVKRFAKENRRGLTTQEGIDLITQHPEILQDHYINLVGSRYWSADVPYLYLLKNGRPELYYNWENNGSWDDGSPSCENVKAVEK